MTLKQIWQLLPEGLIQKLLPLIIIQQLMIAGSTYALGEAGLQIHDPHSFIFYVVMFLALTLLPQGMTVLIRSIETRGYWGAYGNFISERLLVHSRRASLWQNHNKKEKFQTAIGPDADSFLTAVLFSVFDIFLFGLTIVLNVTALAMVVDGWFPYAFLVSGLLSASVFYVFEKRITGQIEVEQTQKLEVFSYLLKSWDNIFLNNPSVESAYKNKLQAKFETAGVQAQKSRLEVELSTFILTTVSHLPIFALIVYLAFENVGDSAVLTALLVTVPRQMFVLNNFKNFFEQINSLIAFKARVKSSYVNSEIEVRDIQSQIRFSDIAMGERGLTSLPQTLSHIRSMKSGRLVITGKNGAGKSTMMLALNEQLENSFYLPSNPWLEIGQELGVESTGQRILKHLEAAMASGAKYLLLDEWDANLDAENRERLHSILSEISRTQVLIEIRHHG